VVPTAVPPIDAPNQNGIKPFLISSSI